MKKLYVYQDGANFYIRYGKDEASAPFGTFTVPFEVEDMDTERAMEARAYIVRKFQFLDTLLIFV